MDAVLDVEDEGVRHRLEDEGAVRLQAVVAGDERHPVEPDAHQLQFLAVEPQRRAGRGAVRVPAELQVGGDRGAGLGQEEFQLDLVDQEIGRPITREPGRLRGLVAR